MPLPARESRSALAPCRSSATDDPAAAPSHSANRDRRAHAGLATRKDGHRRTTQRPPTQFARTSKRNASPWRCYIQVSEQRAYRIREEVERFGSCPTNPVTVPNRANTGGIGGFGGIDGIAESVTCLFSVACVSSTPPASTIKLLKTNNLL